MRKILLIGAAAAVAAIATLGAGAPASQLEALRTLTLSAACTPQQALAAREALGALLAGAQAFVNHDGF